MKPMSSGLSEQRQIAVTFVGLHPTIFATRLPLTPFMTEPSSAIYK
jgi:hypothetical protein